MKRTLFCSISLALALTASAAHADTPLPAGISGAWFQPESGHGMSIEILSDNDALVFWHTYDTDGRPFNLYLEAKIDGNTLSGTALAPQGSPFGTYNPADFAAPAWGDVRIAFDDCNTATLEYDALDAAYGEGEFVLRRLTRIKDSTCALAFPERLPAGAYDATLTGAGADSRTHAAIDADGRLYAVSTLGTDDAPTQPWINPYVHTVRGELLDATNRGNAAFALDIRLVTWLAYSATPMAPPAVTPVLEVSREGIGEVTITDSRGHYVTHVSLDGPSATRVLDTDLTAETLAGTYQYFTTRFVTQRFVLTIDADGSMCINAPEGTSAADCEAKGEATVDESGFFDFDLPYGLGRANTRGRGWVSDVGGRREIVLTGDNGAFEMGVVAVSP